jgi:predicted transcriptional regulator
MDGGAAKVSRAGVRNRMGTVPQAKVAALGTTAVLLARRLVAEDGLPQLDFEFAADRAAFNAAERGLDVWLLTGRDRVPEVLATFESLNARTLRRVHVETTDAPLLA